MNIWPWKGQPEQQKPSSDDVERLSSYAAELRELRRRVELLESTEAVRELNVRELLAKLTAAIKREKQRERDEQKRQVPQGRDDESVLTIRQRLGK